MGRATTIFPEGNLWWWHILMSTNTSDNSFHEFIVIVACISLITKNILSISSVIRLPNTLLDLLLVLFLVCVMYKIIMQKYTFISLVITMGIACLCAYSCYLTKYYSLFYSYIFILSLQGIRLKKILTASILFDNTCFCTFYHYVL